MKRTRESFLGMENFHMGNCLLLLSGHGIETKQSNVFAPEVFECKTCNRQFPSFQALGGHRASHKRPKLESVAKAPAQYLTLGNKPKLHECSLCGLKFSLGQALGGHMRRHRAEQMGESTDSLSSPMYLHLDQLTNDSFTQQDKNSEPPRAFLSLSPQTHEDPSHENPLGTNEIENDDIDDVEKLMQLLDLSGGEKRRVDFDDGYDDNDDVSCHCEGGFFAKIAEVKGPKCKKEAKRLGGWIQHFLNGGEQRGKKEPLRLAHLLLGKAAFLSEGADYGFGGIEFPSTIEEFLHNDPPKV